MRKLLRPTNEYATDAILPGDPAIALALAQELIDGPLMANHSRGLWGYTGPAKSQPGALLSIQSTGYGNQSAAAVITQLGALGVRRAIRLGTCVALDASLEAGSQILVGTAVGHDGRPHEGSIELAAGLGAAHPGPLETGVVASVDTAASARTVAADSIAADGGTAGLLAAAELAGVAVAAALLVVESAAGELDDEQAHEGLIKLGRVALEALGASYADVARVKRR
jgi:uridine phosphorylase